MDEPKEPCIRWGPGSPEGEGAILGWVVPSPIKMHRNYLLLVIAVNVVLSAFAAERRAAAPMLLSAGACCRRHAAIDQFTDDAR